MLLIRKYAQRFQSAYANYLRFEYDFYLCAHSAIQGTARPVHYHVILDEAGVPPNEFQRMVYQMSYQYMRSTTPVSLCKFPFLFQFLYLT